LGTIGKKQTAALALAAVVGLALVGWVAARQIQSPAEVAANTAPPKPSPITVPVVRRTLSTDVIVRGTVRYGAPVNVALATSAVKAGSSDLVTRPAQRNARLRMGDVAMAVDGRPVFVLPGTVPMHRDLYRGLAGPDVFQLEAALRQMGFDPGAIDGRFDAATGRGVSNWYLSQGFDPFGATDLQLDQMRTAQTAVDTARDARLQALNSVEQAQQTPTNAEIAQARLDAATARDAYDTAVLTLAAARVKLSSATAIANSTPSAEGVAQVELGRDRAAADADVADKQRALNAALNAQRLAQLRFNEIPLDALQSDREAAAAAVRETVDDVRFAQAQLNAAMAAAKAVSATGGAAVGKARKDAAQAARDVRSAREELSRAKLGVTSARKIASLSALRARVIARPQDTNAMHALIASAAQEERRAKAEVARFGAKAGVQVPANEVIFFRTLPLRVDAVTAKLGSIVTGNVMTVTNARLAVDSSLSIQDAGLVRPGNRVVIDAQDLGIKTTGTVTFVASKPGTNKVDPSRVYMEVTPATGPVSLVGASVKLTIAVKSTKGAVMAVPVSSLSVSGDGNTRIRLNRGGRSELVNVIPGLAAGGLVEVRPEAKNAVRPGDLVIVGERTARAASTAGG
jgi:hypothetical protein